MNGMVERVAKAMSALAVSDGYPTRWDALGDDGREAVRSLARSAIEAMREPTAEMLFVGSNDDAGFTQDNLLESWRLMIDEALKGEETK